MSRDQQERERQKALLLRQINSSGWISTPAAAAGKATAPIDRGWNTLLNLRSWAMVGSGLVAVWSVRHPRFCSAGQNAASVSGARRMARKLLQQTASR